METSQSLLSVSSDGARFSPTSPGCLHCFSVLVGLWRLGSNSQSSRGNVQQTQCLRNFPLPYIHGQNVTQRPALASLGKGLSLLQICTLFVQAASFSSVSLSEPLQPKCDLRACVSPGCFGLEVCKSTVFPLTLSKSTKEVLINSEWALSLFREG